MPAFLQHLPFAAKNPKKRHLGHIEIPLQRVHVELTNACNFNCRFCPNSEMQRPVGFMETGLAKRVISEIGGAGVCEKITLHVMGEPTLHPDFIEIVEHALGQGVKIGLTTNGSTLAGKLGRQLLDHELHQIDVSLQTHDEQSFALRNAGRRTFEKYTGDIFDFFSEYAPKHPATRFKFRFLNTRFPCKELEEKKGPIRVICSTAELRKTFKHWATRVYDILGVSGPSRTLALQQLDKLVSYKWNVVEIFPNVFFETYVLGSWGHAFADNDVRDAWAGYCFGMRDHFAILHNGDVTLCCMDFDGRTRIGNLHGKSLEEVLSSDRLKTIIDGFKRYRLVHPYCKRCMGSRSLASWLIKPVASVVGLKLLRPFFHAKTKVCA